MVDKKVSRPGEIARRRQLVDIAFDHIAKKGFEGLRFQEVAKEAGVNSATLYYYFPSKEELIKGVTDSLIERLKSQPDEESPPHQGNALQELRQLFEEARRRLASDPAFFIVITELALRARRDAAIDRIGQQRDDHWSRRIIGILERGITEGLFRADLHVESTAVALMAQLKGAAHHAAMRRRRPGEIDAIVSTIAAQVEHWLTCPGEIPGAGG